MFRILFSGHYKIINKKVGGHCEKGRIFFAKRSYHSAEKVEGKIRSFADVITTSDIYRIIPKNDKTGLQIHSHGKSAERTSQHVAHQLNRTNIFNKLKKGYIIYDMPDTRARLKAYRQDICYRQPIIFL